MQRRELRLTTSFRVRYATMDELVVAYSSNLSRGGLFLKSDELLPVGARVMFTALNDDGSAKESVPFAEGWLDEETGEYLGRPVDVLQMKDGSLLVSDDLAGAIYRISYSAS